MRRLVFACLIVLGASQVRPSLADEAPRNPTRPNIVVIMADDMGYSDLGCFGGEVHTPNLDRLARSGLRLAQFYNNARCCPTRASLMTGLWSHQAGVGRMNQDEGLPGYRGTIGPNTVTIAEVLRAAGYHTAMVGKWHLSAEPDAPRNPRWVSHKSDHGLFGDPRTFPTARGFEHFFGTIWGVSDYFDPFSLVEDGRPIPEVPPDFYYTDAISSKAVESIERARRSDDNQPLFLYVAYTAPHWPLHAREEDIERYENVYNVGWDAIRRGRYERMVAEGLLTPDQAALSPRVHQERHWDDNPFSGWNARAMAVHAAMVDRMDQGIGRIVECLRQQNMLDNTLILFLSDNGASPEVPSLPGFDRPSHTRDGRRVHYPVGKGVKPGPETTWAAIGPMWANVANTPFRYWKKELYEGGIRTPLIAHWPAGLKTAPGTIGQQPGHVIDIMATCVDLARTEYPASFEGRPITPMQGTSLLPSFHGEKTSDRTFYWEHYGARAVRFGDWKLVSRAEGPWELYNLREDSTEMHDRAGEHPEVVSPLSSAFEKWARETAVEPTPPNLGLERVARGVNDPVSASPPQTIPD